MKPMVLAGLVLLAFTLACAVLGMVLARFNTLRVRDAGRYTRLCTLMVLAVAYGLTQYDWPGLHLRQVDFWSLMVILGIAAYAIIWAAIAHQFNRHNHEEFGESFMLSMLFDDPEHKPVGKTTDSNKPG